MVISHIQLGQLRAELAKISRRTGCTWSGSKSRFYFTFQALSTRHFCHDLELHGGDLISSPVDSIVSLVLPKKSYGPNSVGKKYFSATPFSLLAKNATGGHNA